MSWPDRRLAATSRNVCFRQTQETISGSLITSARSRHAVREAFRPLFGRPCLPASDHARQSRDWRLCDVIERDFLRVPGRLRKKSSAGDRRRFDILCNTSCETGSSSSVIACSRRSRTTEQAGKTTRPEMSTARRLVKRAADVPFDSHTVLRKQEPGR